MKGDNAPSPQPVPGLHGVVQIAAGGPDDVALLANGTVMGWGENRTGQLGPGPIEKTVPTLVPGLSNVKAVAIGGFPFVGGHLLALMNNGTVMSVGRNDQGQLGNGGTTDSSQPVPVKGLSGAVAVSADVSHSLALTQAGTVYAWGGNTYGQLGVGSGPERCGIFTCSRLPVALGLRNVTSISAGFRDSIVVSNGKPFAWGWNVKGELGDGTRDQRNTPVPVLGLQEATAVAAGFYHTLAVLKGSGPPAPIEVSAGVRSLTVRWRSGVETQPWHVAFRPLTRPPSDWSHGVLLAPDARSYTITGLPPVPYQVLVKNVNFGPRVAQGTPLR
jgi:alpha-tubulin suppressor-like RCC1 family protein